MARNGAKISEGMKFGYFCNYPGLDRPKSYRSKPHSIDTEMLHIDYAAPGLGMSHQAGL